ncbi:MAG: AAA family ATPase [Clostridiales bacterium]|jgi:5-methylcytosine-specific restriction protein B|nr:AAA family ATPase [Clostridiales bacterium]
MEDNLKISQSALQRHIAQYKDSFAERRASEIFKWKAVKCFQDNWDIDAPDLRRMIVNSLAQTRNLLSSNHNFPGGMLREFANLAPEELRVMFRELFDESESVVSRAQMFADKSGSLKSRNAKWGHDFQSPTAISTYLWLRYPDKYYIYKYSAMKDNAWKLCGATPPSDKYERMVFGFKLYDAICSELSKDSELVSMSSRSLGADCYPDRKLKTLTIDLAYFISTSASDSESLAEGASGRNLILYGTFGTGKTYSAVAHAVSTVQEQPLSEIMAMPYSEVHKLYLEYMEQGLIAFVTFHQSFGYEEFIEGIRPVAASDGCQQVQYEVRDGVFKAFCDRAGIPEDSEFGIGNTPTVWTVAIDSEARMEQLDKGLLRLGEKTDQDSQNADLRVFQRDMQVGDLVLSCRSSSLIDAIGVVSGKFEWRQGQRNVSWLSKGVLDISALCKPMSLSPICRLSVSASDVLLLLQKENPALFTTRARNRVFVIDEINRGNISKIFGELITLIEPSKRIGAPEELRARLPCSGQNFGVPSNVYIVGTMNTSDRSIAMIDQALRHRFSFLEMKPDSSLLKNVIVEGIDIAEALDTINRRITVLLDREHTIGHACLLPLRGNASFEMLADIFKSQILPLLQEYFFDDYEKIQLVLGDNQKRDDSDRFVVKRTDAFSLFGDPGLDLPDFYEVNETAFMRIEAYAFLS